MTMSNASSLPPGPPVLKLIKTIYRIGAALETATAGIALWGIVAFHIYTVVVAYRVSGLVGSILTAIWPPFTELYWLIRYRFVAGSTVNGYSVWFLILLLIVIVHMMCRHARRQVLGSVPGQAGPAQE